jgi:hypothetical protein
MLAMAGSLAAQDATQGAVKIVRIKGQARFSTSGGVFQPLKAGMVLHAGAIIQTASGSFVDIVMGDVSTPVPRQIMGDAKSYQPMADQNIVRMHENAVLAVDKLTATETGAGAVTEIQLDLQRGSIFGNTKKLSAGSKYEIKLPNGVAGIRGTIYNLSSDGVVQVLVGSVVMAYVGPDGNVVTQVVMGGQQFDARTGQITSIPNFDQKTMVKEAKETRVGPNTPPTTFTVDQTIYYVSPTQGQNGSGAPNPGNAGNPGSANRANAAVKAATPGS